MRFNIPKQPEELVFIKKAPQDFGLERATIAFGKARVKTRILGRADAGKNQFFRLFGYTTYLSFASILCGVILNYLDQSLLPIALPTIGKEFGASPELIQWVVNGYTLLFACLVLLGGKIGDAIGPKNGFLIGIVLFAFFSVLCGFSQNIGFLICARTMQALGASLMFPAQAAMLSRLLPVHQQGRAIGLFTSLGMGVGFLGPFISGLLTQLISWRAIFWINIPITLLGFLLGAFSLPKIAPIKDPIDWRGFVYFALTICPITFMLIQVTTGGADILGKNLPFFLCSLISAIFLLRRMSKAEHPIFDFKLLKYPTYTAIFLSQCIIKFIMMISIFQIFYCETILHYTQIETGMLFSCSFLPSLIFSSVSGYLADKISPRFSIYLGYILVLSSLFWLAFHSTPSLFDLLLSLIVYGMGLPLIITPAHSLTLSCVPKNKVSIGTGMIISLRMTAASLGLAMIHLFTSAIQRINTPILGAESAMIKSFASVHLSLALLCTATFITTILLFNKQKGSATVMVAIPNEL